MSQTQGKAFQHILKLRNFPSDRQLAAHLAKFRNAAMACLFYAHDASLTGGDELPSDDATGRLNEQLSISFYERLFVDRPVIGKISSLIKEHRMLLVTGNAGCGKTTALRRVRDQYEQHPRRSLHYVDLKERFPRLGSSQTIATVCSLIYDTIYDALIRTPSVFDTDDAPPIRRRWRTFRVRHHSAYGHLLKVIEEDHGDVSNDELERLIDLDRYASLRLGQSEPLRASANTEDLEVLLRFLKEQFDHRCIVLVDNIDRYGLTLQGDVIDKAIDFASMNRELMTPVVAVRTANYRRIMAHQDAHSEDQFPGKGQYIHLTTKLGSREERLVVSPDSTTLQAFVRQRLSFLGDLPPEQVMGEQGINALTSQLGYSSVKEFVEDHMEVLTALTRELSDLALVQGFSDWHNDDLRAIGAQICNLISAFLTGRDPFINYQGLVVSGRASERAKLRARLASAGRLFRTMALRHMIFGDNSPLESPLACNIFDLHSAAATRRFYFLKLKLLEFVAASESERTTYGAIRSTFSRYGVPSGRLFEHLKQLRYRWEHDSSGLLYVDRSESKLAQDMPDHVDVELSPAGRWFLNGLSLSCEYVFWMSLHTPLEKGALPEGINPDATKSDAFRGLVAARFLRDVILPRFEQEYADIKSPLTGNRRWEGAEYGRLFIRNGPAGVYPERAAALISEFLVRAPAREKDDEDTLRSALEMLERVRDRCQKVFAAHH